MKKRIAAHPLGEAKGRSRSNIIVGGLIAAARRGKMTQARLGEALGRDQPAIAKIEAGVRQVDATELLSILDLLQKDPTQFFNELRAELQATAKMLSDSRKTRQGLSGKG